jgi:hypothetical protein
MKSFFLGVIITLLFFLAISHRPLVGGCEFYFYATLVNDTCYLSDIEFCKGSKMSGGIEGMTQMILKRNSQAKKEKFRTEYKTFEFSNGIYTRGIEEEKHTKSYMLEWKKGFEEKMRKKKIKIVAL